MSKNIPAIAPNKLSKEELKLIADRTEWEKQYDYWLKRKNKFAAKLAAKSKPTNLSTRYKELDAEVKKYWQKLRDSLPAYKALFVQKGK